jgi:Aspartyl protease
MWLLTGCASAPPRSEKQSPQLATAQISELRKRAKSPGELGIDVTTDHGRLLGARGINELSAANSVTVPLIAPSMIASAGVGVPYRLPCILATINGREDQRVLLDSGSNRLLLGYSLAANLDIPLIAGLDPVAAHGIGGQGKVDSYWAVVPQMNVGAVELRRLVALVGPDAEVLTYRRGFWGNAQVMILGVNALRQLSYLSLDYPRGMVTFGSKQDYLPDSAATSVTAVPLRWEHDLPTVDIVLERHHRTSCVVDTGGDYGLFLSRAVATELGYWKPGWGGRETSRGIAGEEEGKGYVVHEVKIGDVTFRQVPARARTDGPEPLGGRVLLGNYELRQYRVTFDFKRSVLWLER